MRSWWNNLWHKLQTVSERQLQPKGRLYHNESSLKWAIAAIGFTIGVASVWYMNMLVRQLVESERRQIDFFAKVQAQMANFSYENPDVTFLLTEVIEANDRIPVVLVDEQGQPISFRNIEMPESVHEDEDEQRDYLLKVVEHMREDYEPIVIHLGPGIDNYIYYTNSRLVHALRFAPIVQFSVLAVFAVIAYLIFSSSRRAEQNRVWVGMAKETAHQLGTPISSLSGWVEYFRADGTLGEDILRELEKDIDRLKMVTERFSNIGSIPSMQDSDLGIIIKHAADYLSRRISSKVELKVYIHERGEHGELVAQVNTALFEWVIENLCKNAVDAMNSKGSITIEVSANKERITIDITDTGKGIPKGKLQSVFRPGYTTKKRGWGLGLALAKRIVEDYHGGRIFVKQSVVGQGTTFRILMPKEKKA